MHQIIIYLYVDSKLNLNVVKFVYYTFSFILGIRRKSSNLTQ